MATKTINTRIKNRVDSLAKWQAEGVSLLPGEIALVKVITQTIDDKGQIVDVPAVLMKVGESDGNGGTKAFDELPWLSAIAADVYDWAKSASATDVPVTIGSTTSTLGAYLTQVNTNTSDISKNVAAIAKLNGNSSTAGSVAKAIADAIAALDGKNAGSAGTGKYVSQVVQTNGIVTTTYSAFPAASTSAAGIAKLGVTGGAAKHDDVFGTGTGAIATRLSTAEGDISNLKSAIAGGVHFRGTVTIEPGTLTTTVNGVTIAAGDIVIYEGKEYICTAVTDSGPSWEQLGDVTRIGNLETKINNLDVTTTNEVATTHEFVSQVTQADGKVAVTYTQPAATDVSFNDATNDTVAKKIAAMDAEIAGKALSGHTHSAYINQNAFSNIKVGTTTVAADTATDTVEFVGSNITITPDAANDKVTFAVASGSIGTKGIVALSDAINSTSSSVAATANAVRKAYELANSATGDAAEVKANYVRFNATDKHMYVGTEDADFIIFDCGGASGWEA